MNVSRRTSKLDRAFLKVYREEALVEQNGECCYCLDRLSYKNVTSEHKQPKSLGGSNAKDNIAGSCGPCNAAKSDTPDSKFKSFLKTFPSGKPIAIIMAWHRRRINLSLNRLERNVMKICR